jgi:predicted metal-binding membrane protein
LFFAVNAAMTVMWCASMSAVRGMPMPGGWTMSMAWMRMPGQTWFGAMASFVGMWFVMTMAMMLPALSPTLWSYREAAGRLAAFGAGYFFVWTAIGLAIYPIGAGLAELEMQHPALSRAVPIAAGVIVLLAGAVQFSAWKVHHLACCRAAPCGDSPADAVAAWRHGLRLGLHCSCDCAGLTTILLVLGVMDLGAMAVVTAAISAERLVPNGTAVARVVGAAAIATGLYLITRAA